ncbi:MAG: hypothetical protein AB8B61_06120 [Cyclobacteriaceae bacterium]
MLPLQEAEQLKFIGKESPFSSIDFRLVDGHTEQQMLPIISYKDRKVAYVADLIPSVGHMKVPYVMSYDIRPLLSMKEKASFLDEAITNNYTLFFEHDPSVECASLKATERGVQTDELFTLSTLV